MAAPTFVTAGTVASGVAAVVPGLPAGWAQDDILVILCESGGGEAIPAVTGYSDVTSSPVSQGTGVSGTRLTVRWKRATASESDPTVGDSGDHQLARMVAIRGCKTSGNPWNGTPQASVDAVSDTSGSATGYTTTADDCLVLIAGTGETPDAVSTTEYSGWTNANLTSLTERVDNAAADGNGGSLGAATGVLATAGAIGATTYTKVTAGWKAQLVIAFEPPAAAGAERVRRQSKRR